MNIELNRNISRRAEIEYFIFASFIDTSVSLFFTYTYTFICIRVTVEGRANAAFGLLKSTPLPRRLHKTSTRIAFFSSTDS